MNGRKRFLAKQLSPSMKSVCVDRFQKRSLDRSLSFILFLRKKIEKEACIVLNDTRFFRFLRFFYSSMSKGQYLRVLFRNKFKHNKFAKLKKFHRWFRYASDSISRRIELLLICQHAFSIDFTFSLAIDTREIVLIGY